MSEPARPPESSPAVASGPDERPASLVELEMWLEGQMHDARRGGVFDMDDQPDAAVLARVPALHEAVMWLDTQITERWRLADAAAMRSQRQHRGLARISIMTGTAAILMAVAQLALKQSGSSILQYAAVLEGVAVGAALCAVVFGLLAKNDRRWFGQRHLSERLRMLKFLALGQRTLWTGEVEGWRAWVTQQLEVLQTAGDFARVKRWSMEGEIEPARVAPLPGAVDPVFTGALAIYYRCKRVDFQAAYFRHRRDTYQHKTERWRHLSVPIFFLSVVFVIAHFSLEHWHSATNEALPPPAPPVPAAEPSSHHLVEQLAIWCVAAAAMIPVFGLGVRSWFAAFELPRSTNLYAAKYQALVRASRQLRTDAANPALVMRHVAADEHFLENEHREWLRLLLDTEWFL